MRRYSIHTSVRRLIYNLPIYSMKACGTTKTHSPMRKNHLDAIVFTPTEVLNIINGLDASKACGPDGIPPQFLKMCAVPMFMYIAEPLSIFFHKSVSTGRYPNSWRMKMLNRCLRARGRDRYRKNYRPINLLLCLSKNIRVPAVYEKPVFNPRPGGGLSHLRHGGGGGQNDPRLTRKLGKLEDRAIRWPKALSEPIRSLFGHFFAQVNIEVSRGHQRSNFRKMMVVSGLPAIISGTIIATPNLKKNKW